MTIQTLKSCRTVRSEIESLSERITRLRSQAERMSRPLSLAPSGGQQRDELAEYAAKLDALERELTGRMISLEEQLREVEEWLSVLPAQQSKVMRLRYVEGKSWDEVSAAADLSTRHCQRIHENASGKCR